MNRHTQRMKNPIIYFKFVFIGLVLYGFSTCKAGSYEDYFQAIKQDDALTVQRLVVAKLPWGATGWR